MIISIESNIGGGKTTVLKALNGYYDVIFEPVDDWIKSGMLQKFYADPKANAYEFQSYIVISMYERIKHMEDDDQNIYILERSVASSLLFASVLKKQGMLTELEHKNIVRLVDALQKPSETIYLKTDPKICMERIKERNRTSEDAIDIDYLNTLHDEHESRFKHVQHVIDGNNNKDDVLMDTLRAIQTIKNKIVIQN